MCHSGLVLSRQRYNVHSVFGFRIRRVLCYQNHITKRILYYTYTTIRIITIRSHRSSVCLLQDYFFITVLSTWQTLSPFNLTKPWMHQEELWNKPAVWVLNFDIVCVNQLSREYSASENSSKGRQIVCMVNDSYEGITRFENIKGPQGFPRP